jgi:hypothetical protein
LHSLDHHVALLLVKTADGGLYSLDHHVALLLVKTADEGAEL